jgi:hypothetical protein
VSREDLLAQIPGLTSGPLPTSPVHRPDDPGESVTRRRTRRNNELIAAGRHPATGAALIDAGWHYRCGDCSHAVRFHVGNKKFWKCELHRLGMSASEASDIRVGWPACSRFRLDA